MMPVLATDPCGDGTYSVCYLALVYKLRSNLLNFYINTNTYITAAATCACPAYSSSLSLSSSSSLK